MTPFELKASLESMTLLVDSREQPTENWKKRIELNGVSWSLGITPASASCRMGVC